MRLPLLISVPHAGTRVPSEVASLNRLTAAEIVADGDEGAAEVYGPLKDHVREFVTTDVGRPFVDMNRAESDIRKDGVVKTHTCWDVPVYREPLPEATARGLIERYHRPYHAALAAAAENDSLVLGLDCHTMAAAGPPVGPDPGKTRPAVCLGNADGTCTEAQIEAMAEAFRAEYGTEVTINDPFSGGHVIRHHAGKLPWIQIELSRAPLFPASEKSRRVLAALRAWVDWYRRQAA